MTPVEFQELLRAPEKARVEFKSGSGGYHFDDLAKYSVAPANEGGGTIILGVSDARPRRGVGTSAFTEPGRTEAGRGTRYMLSRRFDRFIGQGGVYTRRRGLDRETNEELLLRHIQDPERKGTTLGELQQVLPNLRRSQIQRLVRELRDAGRVRVEGERRWARWFPANAKATSSEGANRSKEEA